MVAERRAAPINLSLRHLKAFLALVETRNFTRAAERCNLTQSAFSAVIASLESGLGVRLFARSTRNVEPTPEGEVFEPMAARLVADLERAALEMSDHAQRRKGRVTIAALPSISSGILPGIIRGFETRWPGIDVVIHDVYNTRCIDLVRAREADLALCAAPAPDHDLRVEQLGSDSFHFVCPAEHPLARQPSLTAAELIAMPIIVFEPNSSIRQHLDACVYPARWTAAREVHNLSTAAGLVAAGLGVTVVPTIALSQFAHRGLSAVPVDLPINERGICLVQRRDGEPSTAAQAFIELLRSQPWQVEASADLLSRPGRA